MVKFWSLQPLTVAQSSSACLLIFLDNNLATLYTSCIRIYYSNIVWQEYTYWETLTGYQGVNIRRIMTLSSCCSFIATHIAEIHIVKKMHLLSKCIIYLAYLTNTIFGYQDIPSSQVSMNKALDCQIHHPIGHLS